MFRHLDDPSPPAPGPVTRARVLARAGAMRRRRRRAASGLSGVVLLGLGVVIGLLVPRSASTPTYSAFTSQRGVLASGTPVPQPDLADVVFVDRVHGFALALHGEQSILAASTDAGATWRVRDGALPIAIPAQLEFADTSHAYLWGGAPQSTGNLPLWRSDDGGRTWSVARIGPVVSDVSAIHADVWAVVGTCPIGATTPPPSCAVVLERSTDNGATWSQSATPPPVHESAGLSISDQDIELARITRARAYVLSFVSSGSNAGTTSGQLVYTSDSGLSWVTRVDPCPPYFRVGEQLAASGTNDLWLMCASQASGGSQAKALFRSSDGGVTWTLSAAANAPALSDNVTLPATTGTAVGTLPTAGYVAPYSLGHDNLAVLSPEDAWLFPDRAGVFRTDDGGRTWALVPGLARAGLVVGASGNVVFADATHGWVCETGAGLWRTTDGVTWQRQGPAGQ